MVYCRACRFIGERGLDAIPPSIVEIELITEEIFEVQQLAAGFRVGSPQRKAFKRAGETLEEAKATALALNRAGDSEGAIFPSQLSLAFDRTFALDSTCTRKKLPCSILSFHCTRAKSNRYDTWKV